MFERLGAGVIHNHSIHINLSTHPFQTIINNHQISRNHKIQSVNSERFQSQKHQTRHQRHQTFSRIRVPFLPTAKSNARCLRDWVLELYITIYKQSININLSTHPFQSVNFRENMRLFIYIIHIRSTYPSVIRIILTKYF